MGSDSDERDRKGKEWLAHTAQQPGSFSFPLDIYMSLGMELELELEMGMGFHSFPFFSLDNGTPLGRRLIRADVRPVYLVAPIPSTRRRILHLYTHRYTLYIISSFLSSFHLAGKVSCIFRSLYCTQIGNPPTYLNLTL